MSSKERLKQIIENYPEYEDSSGDFNFPQYERFLKDLINKKNYKQVQKFLESPRDLFGDPLPYPKESLTYPPRSEPGVLDKVVKPTKDNVDFLQTQRILPKLKNTVEGRDLDESALEEFLRIKYPHVLVNEEYHPYAASLESALAENIAISNDLIPGANLKKEGVEVKSYIPGAYGKFYNANKKIEIAADRVKPTDITLSHEALHKKDDIRGDSGGLGTRIQNLDAFGNSLGSGKDLNQLQQEYEQAHFEESLEIDSDTNKNLPPRYSRPRGYVPAVFNRLKSLVKEDK